MEPRIEITRAALMALSPRCGNDEWVTLGFAVKNGHPGDDGLDAFDEWSQQDSEGYDRKRVLSFWKGAAAHGKVTYGTLRWRAERAGFVWPKDDTTAPVPDSAELHRQRARNNERERAAAARTAEAQRVAGEQARELWNTTTDEGAADHPYLTRKGVGAHGVRVAADGRLLVPLRDETGDVVNVQRIAPEKPGTGTDKLYLKDARKSGCWHMIGSVNKADAILVAEGYATAASVHEATGRPVAVAFDAGNLRHVAKALRKAHGSVLIVVCGDDDRATELKTGSNPGREAANKAAAGVHGIAVLPKGLRDKTTDFNDLHAQRGLDTVREQIEAAIAARQAQQSTAPASEAEPKRKTKTEPASDAQRHQPFLVTDEGVYYCGTDRDGNPTAPQWLCGRLEVVARTRDADGLSWGYLLRFADPAGREREWAMPARMLSGDGGEYRAILLNMGLSIATSPALRARLTEYLQRQNPEAMAVCAERTGWHATGDGGAAYVLPDQTIGEAGERIVFQNDGVMERAFRQRRDVAAWRDRIGALCVGNSRLVFAASCAFAGPLMRPAGVDSGGFHLRGDSSSGKTTALQIAASVNGGPNYMQRWRTTDNALEVVAALHCDALLILDELAQVDGRMAGECAYMLANESSKGRAARSGALRGRLTWRLLFLSAGEVGLSQHMAEAMKRARVGQEVRMVDLNSDAGAGMGVIEALHGREGSALLSDELKHATTQAYGAPGLAWLHWLAPRWRGLPKSLSERMAALRMAWVPEGASGQVERVAARFALVATAGEMATEAQLTGWPAGEAERAARVCFESWLAARGGAGNDEVRQMLRQVRSFCELHGDGRFTWWHRGADDHAPKTLHRAGFRRLVSPDGTPIKSNSQFGAEFGDRMPTTLGEEMQTEYFILSEVFRREVCEGFDPNAVLRALLEHDCIEADEGRLTVKPRLPGLGPTRCVHIKPAIMALDV